MDPLFTSQDKTPYMSNMMDDSLGHRFQTLAHCSQTRLTWTLRPTKVRQAIGIVEEWQ